MRLHVEHTTTFRYTRPVHETATEIRLQPSEDIQSRQRVLESSVRVTPEGAASRYDDYFGNCVLSFNLLQQLSELRIVSTALVETGCERTRSTPLDALRSLDMLHESRFTPFDDALRAFAGAPGAGESGGKADDPLTVARALCGTIYQGFSYQPGVTDVHSSSSEVIALRRGVCQDFAHVLIAACRVRGIPARYVSGYLYGGIGTERDDRASHAWCEVYAGPEEGWVALDPTHQGGGAGIDERYIKIGVGRDYADVPPVRGTYKGKTQESMHVVVRVTQA